MLTMVDGGRVVVAGAGLAGLRTVTELLAERGFTGRITLIGAEARPPYDRPPLSKKVLIDQAPDPSLQADFGALDVAFRPGEAAIGVDAGALATDRATPIRTITWSWPPGRSRWRFPAPAGSGSCAPMTTRCPCAPCSGPASG